MKIISLSVFVLASALSFVAPLSTHGQTFLFDFGGANPTTGQPETWNTVLSSVGTSDTGKMLNLVSTDNTVTEVDLLMVARFSGENPNGATSSTIFPSSATRDSLYGQDTRFPRFKLTELDVSKTYDFTFYASRSGSENRETLYTVTGGISGSVVLNASNNVNQTVSLFGITPNAAGEILIALDPTVNNNTTNKFTYLGVMVVTAVPEPSSVTCLASGVVMLLARRRRSL